MRFQGYPLLALLTLLTAPLLTPATAAAGPLDPKIVPAIVVSAGRVDSRQDLTGVGSGYFVDANYTRTFLNGGADVKFFSGVDPIANVYAGVGVSKLLQLQMGIGTQGVVRRIRHDLNLTSVYDFITGTKRNRYNTSLGNRLTFTVALENYKDDKRLDNFHIGLGLQY